MQQNALKKTMSAAKVMILAAVFAANTMAAEPEEYSVKIEINGKEHLTVRLSLDENQAISSCEGFAESFNLKRRRWKDELTDQWVTESNARHWAMLKRRKLVSSIETFSKESRGFVEWSMVPEFSSKQNGETTILESKHVRHEMLGKVQCDNLKAMLDYMRFNAYKTAMAVSPLPPYAEQLKIAHIEKRGSIPERIKTTMRHTSPETEMVISFRRLNKSN